MRSAATGLPIDQNVSSISVRDAPSRNMFRKSEGLDTRGSVEREQIPYSNTNGSPSANSALTMMTLTKPIEHRDVPATLTPSESAHQLRTHIKACAPPGTPARPGTP